MDRSTGTGLNTNFCNLSKIGSLSTTPHLPHPIYTTSGNSGNRPPHTPEIPESPETHPPQLPQKSGDTTPAAISATHRQPINIHGEPPVVSLKIAMPRAIGICNFRKLRRQYAEIAGTYPIINALSSDGLTISDAYRDGASHAKTPHAFRERSCRSFENRRALSP